MTEKTKSRTRERTRKLELGEQAPVVSLTTQGQEELKNLVIEVFKANIAQNAAKKEYDKQRKKLLGLMKDKKLTSKIFENVKLSEDGHPITLEALVDTPINDKADIQKLAKLVDNETFLQIVKASKTDIVEYVGAAVFEQVKIQENGTENVSVAVKKD